MTVFTTQFDGVAKGIRSLEDDVERYIVPGGRCIALDLAEGDRVTVLSPEGLQACEVVPFENDGRACADLFDMRPKSRPVLLDAVLKSHQATSLRRGLQARRSEVESARSIMLLNGRSVAGSTERLVAKRDGFAVFGAPSQPFGAGEELPASDLVLLVQRVVGMRNTPELPEMLPDPLGRTREDLRIDAATASVFTVSEGEYFQVLDVRGRQCGDVVLFDRANLDAGSVVGMSDAATRSIMGHTVPTPGLHAKIFDQRYRPMVELVQDTVGIHDTFLTPCTSYYYDNVGYPGHTNCTDNFNAVLAPYGISKDAYSAINLFTNVDVGEGNVFLPDCSWSRAGDYVLFRATRDLVVGTSACPSDIDPVNGWNPTDIHVRIYDKDMGAKRSIAMPLNRSGDKQMTRETAFHARTSTLCSNFTEYKGYWLPLEYRDYGARDEYWACRERVALTDMSALRKFEIVGPGAERLMNWAVTRDVTRIAVGQVRYAAICHAHGAMLDDGTLFRITEQNFRWICNDDACGEWLREQAAARGLEAWVKTSTESMHNLSIQGPASLDLLSDVVWTPPTGSRIADLKRFRFVVGRIGDPNGPPVVVSRTGYTGLLGFELWCHGRDGAEIWDTIWKAGEGTGLVPMGLAALDMLRIEAGFPFSGAEFGGDVDPFEAGIGYVVSSKKAAPYNGMEALAERQRASRKRLVGIVVADDRVPSAGDLVWQGEAEIGQVTSATYSPKADAVIALARINKSFAEPGTEVRLGRVGKQASRHFARVASLPLVPHDA